jgi:hypothetical protein
VGKAICPAPTAFFYPLPYRSTPIQSLLTSIYETIVL